MLVGLRSRVRDRGAPVRRVRRSCARFSAPPRPRHPVPRAARVARRRGCRRSCACRAPRSSRRIRRSRSSRSRCTSSDANEPPSNVSSAEYAPSVFRFASQLPVSARTPVAPTAGEQPDDVDLVRRLVPDHAAASRRVQLFGPARPIQEIGVVERMDHPHGAEGVRVDQCPRAGDRCVEAVAVADDELHAGRRRRVDHPRAVGERQRHRLFDEHVLAVPCRRDRVRRMHLVRRRDVDDVHRRVGAQRLDRRVRAVHRNRRRSARAPRRAGRRRRTSSNARIGDERRQHQRERAAESGHAPPPRRPSHASRTISVYVPATRRP